MDELGRDLSRREASAAVTGLGWRYVLGVLRANLRVGSLAEAADTAARILAACHDDADQRLLVDLAYVDEPGGSGPEDPLVDPLGQGPAVWFQQMDAPRPQRNRIHLDVSVPHDEAEARTQATLAAGGTLRSDAAAPAFWVLADPEGNEACVTTWQGRDPQQR
jgi:hypothetical protein